MKSQSFLWQSELFSDVYIEIRLSSQPCDCSGAGNGVSGSDSDSTTSSPTADATEASGAAAEDEGIVLAKFPGHMAVLCQSDYFHLQAKCMAGSGGQIPSKPVLTLTVDDASHLPATLAVMAALYGVQDSISTLEQRQLADAVQYARMLQLESVVHEASRMHQRASTPVNKAIKDETAIDIFMKCYAGKMGQQFICSMARVCKAWNTAVQCAAPADSAALEVKYYVAHPAIVVGSSKEQHRLHEGLVSLAMWLPKYGKLVSKIEVQGLGFSLNASDGDQYRAIAGPLLRSSLQAAAGQGLQLCTFSTNVLHSNTFLRAIPCAHFTKLWISACDAAELASALPCLRNLSMLRLGGDYDRGLEVARCLPALSQLNKLTCLHLHQAMPFDTRQLPTQLRQLELHQWRQTQQVLDLSHLIQLTGLRITPAGVEPGSQLPVQLLELVVMSSVPSTSVTSAFNLTSLSQLQRLELRNSRETAAELQQLARLACLQELSLQCYFDTSTLDLISSSSLWPHMRQLKGLHLCQLSRTGTMPVHQLPSLLQHIAAITGLTRLHFDVSCRETSLLFVEWCGFVSSLSKLQDLEVYTNDGATCWSGHPHYLKPLTSLTRLKLCSHSQAPKAPRWGTSDQGQLSDAAIASTLLQLPQLQWLTVPVRSTAVLPVVATLRQLRYLRLVDLPLEAFRLSELMRLSSLKNLSRLIGFEKCGEDVIAEFWSAVHS